MDENMNIVCLNWLERTNYDLFQMQFQEVIQDGHISCNNPYTCMQIVMCYDGYQFDKQF